MICKLCLAKDEKTAEETPAYEQEKSGTRKGRGAFRANEYEKEVRRERIRRRRREKELLLEEKERKAVEREREAQELQQQEAKKEGKADVSKRDFADAPLSNEVLLQACESSIRQETGEEKPLKLRRACATCESRDVRPKQVLKYKEMDKVLRGCTAMGQQNNNAGFDYVCLSGKTNRTIVCILVPHQD